MHPDHLPARSPGQRALALAVRVVEFPLLRLVWTVLLFGGATWLFVRLFPVLGRMPNSTLGGSFRRAALATLAAWAVVRLLEGKSLAAALGLWPARAPRGLARGFLLGAGLVTAAVAWVALAGDYQVTGRGDGSDLRSLADLFLLFTCVAVAEEVLARGVLLRLFEQALGTWAALGLSALLFGFGHLGNPGATVFSSVAIAVEGGILLGAAYVASRSLWLPIGMHIGWNFFEGPVLGARVSGNWVPSLVAARFTGSPWLTGGPFGPEAGIPVLVLGTGLGAAAMVVAVRHGQVFTPRWMTRLLARMHRPPAARALTAPAPPP
ncbi:MAG TPA: CPBP family intramembrane glutamic endopeptidase [Myxococcaceae bacterium]|nr:CPBP family intramembrane glutamic endopeptidase [Myxococcaceae bacterium]